MRLYERTGQLDKLCRLGLAIARGDKPFTLVTFDPHTGRFAPGGARETGSVSTAATSGFDLESMPLLGGFIVKKVEHGGKLYLCGTRGLIVQRKGEKPRLSILTITPREVVNTTAMLMEEARRLPMETPLSPGGLKALLRHSNPYVRALALEKASACINGDEAGFTPMVGSSIGDPSYRVRTTAVILLSRIKHPGALQPLQSAMKDPDPSIREFATLSLAQRGMSPPLRFFEEILAQKGSYGNLPFGLDSLAAEEVCREDVYPVLGPRADREVFTLLMKYPPDSEIRGSKEKMMDDLGLSLRRHHDAAALLLQARDSAGDQVDCAR